jgi:hypothetical protein
VILIKIPQFKISKSVSVWAFVIVTILLVLSLVYNIIQQKSIYEHILKPQYSTVVGTYCSGAQESPESEYLVFMQDGTYWRYRQFHVLGQGTYAEADNNIYILNSNDGTTLSQVLCTADQVYLIDADGGISIFSKLDDTPYLINIGPQSKNTPDPS